MNIYKFPLRLITINIREFKMTTKLPGVYARQFRLELLNIYAAGAFARELAVRIARETLGDLGDVTECVTECTAWKAAVRAAWKAAVYAAWKVAGDFAGDTTLCAAVCDIREIEKKRGTIRQIAYASCRLVITNRKKISCEIDNLGDKIPSTSMMTNEVYEFCTFQMTFDKKTFKMLRLTIPLKLGDYLLGCERAISFLRQCGDARYYSLMNKHSELVRRLGLEHPYAKLTVARVSPIELGNYLSTTPMDLIELIIGYCALTQDNPEDRDEIYNRLLLLDEFQVL